MPKHNSPLPIAYSPCPNDTFSFYAWLHGKIEDAPPIEPVYGDIQQLNKWAMKSTYPLSKVSFFTLSHILDEYTLLSSGAALGYGCGPKIIAKKPFPIEDLPKKKIAIPGAGTSAHFYIQALLPPPKQKHFCLYNEVELLIEKGIVDCGLVIHETRFTFSDKGYVEIIDIGDLWETTYGLPIPLGGLVAKKSLGAETIELITQSVRQSILYAFEHPEETYDYVLEHSEIKDPKVVQDHIDLYVNEESIQLSEKGKLAVQTLLELGQQ